MTIDEGSFFISNQEDSLQECWPILSSSIQNSYFILDIPNAIMVPMRTVAVATAIHLLRHFKVIALKACSPDSTPRSMTQMLHPRP